MFVMIHDQVLVIHFETLQKFILIEKQKSDIA